jgi:formate-dependent nitrite reductase membrane component NrfD
METSPFEWGLLIVNYLFLGGLSAGLFFVSALASFLGKPRTAWWGAILSPWPVAFGSALLIFDLGNWYRFYKLFLHFRWQSPMSIGSWLLIVFNGIAFAYFWTTLRPDSRFSRWRTRLAIAGLPLSIAVAIYTGVLLGAVQARPFWNTNLVAQMFLFSALSTGTAALILALTFDKVRPDPAEFRSLYLLDIALIVLECFIVLPYIIHGELSPQAVREALELILGGPYTLIFWLAFVCAGLLAPLVLEIFEVVSKGYSRSLAGVAAVLVVCGGYLLRYIFVYAGQASAFR